MKNTAILLFFVVACCLKSTSQNLVFNGDMEIYNPCPTSTDQIQTCAGYESAQTQYRADYFNRCAIPPNDNADVPANFRGYQDDPDGNGYIGCRLSTNSETISGEFVTPISQGNEYEIQFLCSFGDRNRFFVDSICFFFSGTKFTQSNPMPSTLSPHLCLSLAGVDTLGWSSVSSTFTAPVSGGYFVISNWFENHQFDLIDAYPGADIDEAYIYLDDIDIRLVPSLSSPSAQGDARKPETVRVYDLMGRPMDKDAPGLRLEKWITPAGNVHWKKTYRE